MDCSAWQLAGYWKRKATGFDDVPALDVEGYLLIGSAVFTAAGDVRSWFNSPVTSSATRIRSYKTLFYLITFVSSTTACQPPLGRQPVYGTISRWPQSAIYLVVATVAIWIISDVDPLLLLRQSVQMAGAFAQTIAGLLTVVLDAGVPYNAAAPLTALLCVAISIPLVWFYRNRSPMLVFAIAALASRLWIYYLNTSNLMLVFLLLALWRLAVENTTRGTRVTALFLAVGASLWVPARLSEYQVVQLAEHLIWLAGTIGLLILDRRQSLSHEIEVADQISAAAVRR